MSEHTLSWERVNDLMAENGRLDVVIDGLVDQTVLLKQALREIAANYAMHDNVKRIAEETLANVEAMAEAA